MGRTPDALLRVIASGLLGRGVIAQGGAAESALGGFLHFVMAIVMALAFCTASFCLPTLRRYWFVTGPLYGAGLYVVMNYIVLPLPALAVTSYPEGWRMAGELTSHVLGVGLSISLAARWVMGPR